MQCREQIMEEEVAVTMFDTDKYAPALKQGRETDHCFLSHITYVFGFVMCLAIGMVMTV